MPVKHYTHEMILEELSPYATRGWIKRFIACKNQGPASWLMIVRDFNIQHQAVEYICEDIVRALEPSPESQSLVRAEMEQLEAKGQLDLSTPEKAEEWEKKLEEERQMQTEWRQADEAARQRQREADLAFLASKKERDGQVIPMINQNFTVKPIESNNETAEVSQEDKGGESPPLESSSKEPTPEKPKVEHAKELSETEKAQEAFVPKPPPEKEPEYKESTIKSISTVGEKGEVTPVYQKEEKVESISGLSEDAVKRLNDNGVHTQDQFETMGHEKAKQILGMPIYQSIKDKLK